MIEERLEAQPLKLGFLMVRPVPKLGSSMNSMTHSSSSFLVSSS